MFLKIEGVEKQHRGTVLFPSFDLTIETADVAAVHVSTDARKQLLNWLSGQEALTEGKIYVNGTQIGEDPQSYVPGLGILFLEDGVYERLSVKDYFVFIRRLFLSSVKAEDAAAAVQLEGKLQTDTKELTYSEKRRLHMGKLILQDPDIFILEEPDQNVDIETKRIFLRLFQELKDEGKAVLILTSNMESAITLADHVYRLNEKGLMEIDTESSEEEGTPENNHESEEEAPALQFNKIPTKVNDKMVLFDPPEIDYIESHAGQSNIYIRGEAFPCVFTLNELESKLKSFGFFRCHRSYIVNLQKVREVITWTRNSYSLMLDDSVQSDIPLSKNKMAELRDMLGLK